MTDNFVTMKERHYTTDGIDCQWCENTWPCDARIFIEALGRLNRALNQAAVELSALKSVIQCGESWSPTLDESYRITLGQIRDAVEQLGGGK